MLRRCVAALAAACGCCLAGCGNAGPMAAVPASQPRVLLFGEVHDNAVQHAQRLQAFEALLARGARPALAMEQLDRDRQAAIDALLQRQPAPTADDIVQAASAGTAASTGWNWDFYRPFIALALRYQLPLVAANVGRDEARRVMQGGLAASGFDAVVPAQLLAAHASQIEASHCGMVDRASAERMALAQVARDQFMARVLVEHAARGVVLLAGNAHVRNDIGAPRWLPAAVRAQSQAIGWLEEGAGSDERLAYTAVHITPPQARPDPCEGMRKRLPAKPTPATSR